MAKKTKQETTEAAQEVEKTEGGEIINQTEETPVAGTDEATEATLAPTATLDELEALDMATFYQSDEDEGWRPAWAIRDDGCADWAVRKIAEEKEELDRIKTLAEKQIEAIQEKVDAAQRRYENGTRFLTGKLAEYFETVPHRATKTKESYRLLSGTLTKKLGGTQMKQDDEKLLEYLRASGNEDMIQTTEKPRWGEFKKRLGIIGGQIVDTTTGELVEGVALIEKPDTFTVDI
jgi:phage host-nuclease inhibitor protein Gam